MKLSEYTRRNSIFYRTAHRHWKLCLISGRQLETGTIVISENPDKSKESIGVILYARVGQTDIDLCKTFVKLLLHKSKNAISFLLRVHLIFEDLNPHLKEV